MPKFSREYLRQATSPGMFGLGVTGLGEQLGTGLQGRRARDAQMQMMTLGNQAISASEQGDMQALNMRRQQLMDLLSKTTNEAARENIINAINQINAARPATQARATTNKAESIIKTEQALKDMKTERESLQITDAQGQVQLSGVFTSGQDRAMQALEDRLAVMKQDGQAVTEADSIKYNTKFQRLQKESQLAEQQGEQGRRVLSAAGPFGGEAYKTEAQRLKDAGLGETVDAYEKDQYDLLEARDKADDIRRSREPLTVEEIKTLKDNGFDPSDNIKNDRMILATIFQKTVERQIIQANRNKGGVADVRAHVDATLETLAEYGDLPLNFIKSDLYDKVKDLSDQELTSLAGLLERPSGEELSALEIQDAVTQFIADKFPKQWAAATKYREDLDLDMQDLAKITNSILQDDGIDPETATEEQTEIARRQAEIQLRIAERAVDAEDTPARGGQGRRERRGESVRIENAGIERRTGTGGQMRRRRP